MLHQLPVSAVHLRYYDARAASFVFNFAEKILGPGVLLEFVRRLGD